MAQRPLVAFTICWILGSWAAAGLTRGGAALAGAALALALLAAVAAGRAGRPLAAACLAAYLLAAGERFWSDARNATALTDLLAAAQAADPSASPAYAADAEGTIASAVEIDGDRVQFRVTADTVRVQGEQAPRRIGGERLLVQVRLAARAELAAAAEWRRGDRIRVAGELELPSGPTNFGGFDYGAYLYSQRIHWLLKADGASSVRTSSGPALRLSTPLRFIDAARASLGTRMERLFPAEQAGYMKGLVLGMRDDLDPDMYRSFSQLGMTHILAISGLHVAVFLYVLGGLLKLIRLTRERTLSILMAAVPLYVLLAGCSPSVVRSGIMAVLGLAAARMNKLKDGLHLLAAAALLMLAWDPYMLENVGFQLSFLVTAGLILGVAPVRRRFPAGGKLRPLYDLIAVSLVAQAVSFPLTIYYFNQIHLLSLPANLVLVPFISFVVMPLGGGALLLDAMWHPAGRLAAAAAAPANDLTFGLVERLSALQPLRLIWASPPLWWVIAMYAVMAAGAALLERMPDRDRHQEHEELSGGEDGEEAESSRQRDEAAAGSSRPDGEAPTVPLTGANANVTAASDRPVHSHVEWLPWHDRASSGKSAGMDKRAWRMPIARSGMPQRTLAAGISVCLALAVLLLGAYRPDRLDRSASVSFLDVGQGDSILIRTAGGKHILVDGGGAVSFRKAGEEWRERRDPFDVGRKVVVPLLQHRGVHAIDLLVLSHLDSDHIKGALAVLDAIPVRGLLWNGTVKPSKDAVGLLQSAADKGIPMYKATAGLQWKPDAHSLLTVIGGSDTNPSSVPVVDEQNGQSVALLLRLYDRTFLLTGDADAAEEQRLVAGLNGTESRASSLAAGRRAQANGGPDSNGGVAALAMGGSFHNSGSKEPADADGGGISPIDVMKVSHHGSKTSSSPAWLSFWRPRIGVISVGRNNLYGHPNGDVVERLRGAGIALRRTDRDGEVQFRVTPENGLLVRWRLERAGGAL